MPVCYFCEEDMRSDALRRHCKAKHSCSDVVDKVLANGYKFRRDVDRSNLLVSLKTESSKDNCGYCFDCHTQIPMPAGQCPNKVAYIQRHQCRVVKERKKRSTTPVPAGKFVAPSAPYYKLTEEGFKELKKLLNFEFELNEDLSIDFVKTIGNMKTAMRNNSQALKDAKETAPSTSWKAIAIKYQDALSAKPAKMLRQQITDRLRLAIDFADEDEGVDEDDEYKAVLVGLIHSALDVKPAVDLSARVKELEAIVDDQTTKMTDLANKERITHASAVSHYNAIGNLETRNRQLSDAHQAAMARIKYLEEQLKEKAENVTHTE